MNESERDKIRDKCYAEGPQATLERHFIEAYLLSRGFRLVDLETLPEETAKKLMREACTFASLKLAEVESRARFQEKIRGPA